jgi:hypothetical protein
MIEPCRWMRRTNGGYACGYLDHHGGGLPLPIRRQVSPVFDGDCEACRHYAPPMKKAPAG